MYLTTHRIESLKEPEQRAIHSYLYMHREPVELTASSFEEITVKDPGGELVDRDDQALPRPGGNAVLSYLDIVTQDDVSLADLRRRLDAFAFDITAHALPAKYRSGPIWLKFHIPTPAFLSEINAVDEYQALKEQALGLLKKWLEQKA